MAGYTPSNDLVVASVFDTQLGHKYDRAEYPRVFQMEVVGSRIHRARMQVALAVDDLDQTPWRSVIPILKWAWTIVVPLSIIITSLVIISTLTKKGEPKYYPQTRKYKSVPWHLAEHGLRRSSGPASRAQLSWIVALLNLCYNH